MTNETLFLFFVFLIIFLMFSPIPYALYKDSQRKELLFKSGIKDIDRMSGKQFENYLAEILSSNSVKVERTPSSNDFGADLILDDGNERIAIQAKRHQKKVGVEAVQEVNSARKYYKADEAWVITNSFFTEQAKKLAQSNDVMLFDRNNLIKLIVNTKDEQLPDKQKET